jgi:N utilization substance protein A
VSHEPLRRALTRVVPEIAGGWVQIKAIAGQPGGHCKVALHSTDPDTDPIGACIGLRGSRIMEVLKAVGGRLDLVAWHPNPLQFVVNALRPCEAGSLVPDEVVELYDVVYWFDGAEAPADFEVQADQHIRLAAELTGTSLVSHGPITARPAGRLE